MKNFASSERMHRESLKRSLLDTLLDYESVEILLMVHSKIKLSKKKLNYEVDNLSKI